MALEAFLDSNSRLAMPLRLPVNGAGGILEALSSGSSLKKDEHVDSILRMAQLNSNLTSEHIHSTILGKASTSGFSVGHDTVVGGFNLTLPNGVYLQNHGSTNMDPYIGLHSSPMSISSNNPMNGYSTAEIFSNSSQGGQQGRKRQQLEKATASTDSSKSKSQTCKDLLPVRIKQEPGTVTPVLKKPRFEVNQENIQNHQLLQQQIIPELFLRELQDRNPQLKAMIKQNMQQNQLQQSILNSVPQLRGLHPQLPEKQIRNLVQDQGNQQMCFPPLLDGGICSRRFMQYLYHLRNRPHDNSITYWKKFVSEYYAPGSRKRWCFSLNEKIERHSAGVFCPKSMETWCCEICGSRSGKGLEANFELFPRLFKMKFESGMLDEILFLDLPLACRVPSGLLVLEYRKAIQESIYEKFRVVHEGKLRIIFRQDLKILSWEFCAQNHEEFLLRRLVAPQVNQLVQAAEKYECDIRNGVPARVSSEILRKNCNTFFTAGNQLSKDVELPLVNDLGYPKRFIRCLQIAEVVNTMKDLIAFSQNTKMGPIESLNIYSQRSKTGTQMKEKQGMQQFVGSQNFQSIPEQLSPRYHANGQKMADNGLVSVSVKSSLALPNFNNQFLGQNSNIASPRGTGQEPPFSMDRFNQPKGFNPQSFESHLHNNAPPNNYPKSQSSRNSKDLHEALIDKLLQEMVASNRGKSAPQQSHQNTFSNLLGGPVENRKTSNGLRIGESSNTSRTEDNFTREAASPGNFSAVNHDITVKKEPHSSPDLPEDFRSLTTGFLKNEDLEW
ncbi:hypothetical protein ACJIZ3_004018 [Penstemon smallii]|uniref:Transcriptional regulator SLK2 n=1 Tax=Penstemon smallii TaxID=265156 RepID=A0ABD3S129_9LAMI